jgi:acetoin utilization protein AcuB
MELGSIMTATPRCVRPETDIDAALEIMDSAYVRHLPVVSEAGRLVGMVSDRDILEATGWLPGRNERTVDGGRRLRPASVEAIMKREVVSASPEDTVVTAAVELTGRKIGSLPILKGGILVGIVCESDVIAAYVRRADSGAMLAGENPLVTGLMTQHPVTAAPQTTLAEARRMMRVDDFRHLPVVEHGRLVGMLSDRDLRRAYGAGRAKDTAVEEVMTRSVIHLATEARVRDAAQIFLHNRISAVPILDSRGREAALVGILTVADVLDHCLSALRT